MPGQPSKGWLERIFGQRREGDTPNRQRERKARRKAAVRGAVHGYERSGGLIDKIKKGLGLTKGLVRESRERAR